MLKVKDFERRKYFVRTLEDVTYVMKTEGTIFIFEWMFVLYGSFKIQELQYRKSAYLYTSPPLCDAASTPPLPIDNHNHNNSYYRVLYREARKLLISILATVISRRANQTRTKKSASPSRG